MRLGGINFSASKRLIRRAKSSLSSQFRNNKYLHFMVISYILIFSVATLLRHYSFSSSAWDLGIFNQAFYTTVKDGKLFYYTAELYANPGGTIFGVHFSPILFLAIPFYIILPRPETLLIIQTVILASGAYPTFLLANHIFRNKSVSLSFSFLYLMHPHLHSVNFFDFHPEAFFVPFALFSLHYFFTEKWSKYFLFLILTFFTKEFASLPFLVLASVQLWSERKMIVPSIRERRIQDKKILISIITIAIAILWYIIAKAFIYHFNPSPNPGFTQGEPWRILGGTPLDLSTLGSVTQLNFLGALKFEWEAKLFYLFTILGPLAFLPVIKRSIFLPTLLWFLLAFLSNYPPYYQLGYHYSAFIVPFSIAAAIYGLSKLSSSFNLQEKTLLMLVKRFVLVGLIFALALSLMRLPLVNLQMMVMSDHDRNIYTALDLIPYKASVLTQYDIFPHVSSKLDSFVVPPPFEAFKTKYYHSYVRSLFDRELEFVVIDVNPDVRTYGIDVTCWMVFNELARKENYGLYASIDGVLVYKYMYQGEPSIYKPFTLLKKYYDAPIRDNGIIFKHPLPTGNYSVICRIYVDSKVNGQLFTIEVSQDTDVLAFRNIYGEEITDAHTYQNFAFPLTVLNDTKIVEFGINNLSFLTNVYLNSLQITQTSYSTR